MLLAAVLLLSALAYGAQAQGFRLLTGRNHPELDWRVSETAHFEIVYPDHLSDIAAEAAPIAEESYRALSLNLDVTFDERIRIYLTDTDDIVNGFAVPVGGGYTNIWVHQNEIARNWTGPVKWLRKVIAHELAHIFHYRATRSSLGLLQNIFAQPLPSFWTEGLAQYETERWDAVRGERWLRTAVLEDELSYEDGRSLHNGALRYAIGNSQVRYLASTYGDSTIARLLRHRTPILFGLAGVHDFDDAFEATVGQSYRSFYDEWQRHVNIYYNTLAGQLGRLDSLKSDPLNLPGQYLYDIAYAPDDTTRAAVLALTSLARPVKRLFVVSRNEVISDGDTSRTVDVEIAAEGGITEPVAWSPSGDRIAFSRRVRGRHGSLLHDLFLVDLAADDEKRLTYSRRAFSPAFVQDGLLFIGSESGTANLFLLDLATREERQLTNFTGDVQVSSIRPQPNGSLVAFARFAADGQRDIVLLDRATGELRVLDSRGEAGHSDGEARRTLPDSLNDFDNRRPIWRPDGTQIAYTSLRDGVPNIFVYDMASGRHRRVTHLGTGATAADWIPADSTHPAGRLVAVTSVSKTREEAYYIPADREAPLFTPDIPAGYAEWTRHRPPHRIPLRIPPRPSLIRTSYPYSSWRNITHALSLGLPYYAGADDWGLFGLTSWLEPLGKHQVTALGALSLGALDHSLFFASYINNQLIPTVELQAYSLPGTAQLYDDNLLVEHVTGGEAAISWPLDLFQVPYARTRADLQVRYAHFRPLDTDDFPAVGAGSLPIPEAGEQADLRLSLRFKKQRPYRLNAIHPLDGLGLRAQVIGAAPVLGADTEFLRGLVDGYAVLPGLGSQRLYLYGRVAAQTGDTFVQDYLGFSRYDPIHLSISGVPLSFGDAVRVRGFREPAIGDRLAFARVEYRIPFINLDTDVLDMVALGPTALAAFADAGIVWHESASVCPFQDECPGPATDRLGVGLELKNQLRLFGGLDLTHAIGIAQPSDAVATRDDIEIYYRIGGAVPF